MAQLLLRIGSSVQYMIPCYDDVTSNAPVTLTPITDKERAINNSPHFQEFARRHILLTGRRIRYLLCYVLGCTDNTACCLFARLAEIEMG
ncbi:hypothetical protein T03_15665 [Trichinella britovi]|uniref:Uncharacterized protein n=1 Tax=Trichinella britovi TaxID=45882 RepID=A0A0V1C6F1_TRIBR|nr:hypothetical protein T03_15665 [Trichinella britovi]